MARDVTILMRGNLFRRPLEEVGPENKTFLGPEMATSEASAICKYPIRFDLRKTLVVKSLNVVIAK